MSIQSEIDRINSNVQSALNAVADTGVSVPEGANSDNLPAAVSALANEKQDKLTGAQGQIVGFGPDGNAVAQDKPTYAASEVGAIPTTEKGAANGVATLGADRKIPAEQLPTMDYAAKTHASQHASDGADPITPDAIGAAAVAHSHAAGDVTSGTFAAARIPSLAASKITSGTFAVARGGTGKSSVTSGNFLVGNGTGALTEKTPAQVLSAIGAAASSHNQAASTITAGTFAATGVKAMNGTDYTTARVRNIKASTTDLTAGSSSLSNGDIYLVYE